MLNKIESFSISNDKGLSLEALNYGAIITKLVWQSANKEPLNLVLHFEDYHDYVDNKFYLGGIIGRFANRIKNGKFQLDEHQYQLALNEGSKHLHGGVKSLNRVIWNVEKPSENKLIFSYLSPHNEEGYPGNLDIAVTYELTPENELNIDYKASTDRKTIINLTNHAYFNLSGTSDNSALEHQLQVLSDKIVELDETQLPTGEIKNIASSHFDFQEPQIIRNNLNSKHFMVGYDHCYVFKEEVMKKMAILNHPETSITLEVFSTEPGLQLYTGNELNGKFQKHSGICLETQHFPDSPNHPNFPSTLIEPGKDFRSRTVYKVGMGK